MEDDGFVRRTVETNGVRLHVVECGEGPAVLLCHGFPELWFSWRHQLPVLAAAGYRAIAPDQRGYGGSDRPAAISDYDVVHLGDDLLGVLDGLGEERAVAVGHDWGAIVAWYLAQRAPERLAGVAALSVPFTPRPPVPPIEIWRRRFGDQFFYILHFQTPGVADEQFAGDVDGTLRRFLRSASEETFSPRSEAPPLPEWLSDDDFAVYVSTFRRTGFTGALNWYRNFERNWELTADLAGRKVDIPAMFLAGERDPVLQMMPVEPMGEWVNDLRERVFIPGAGHWIQQERPREVNEVLLRFLAGVGLAR